MTTMQDVAQLAGVSAKTVSRVFNNDPHVADETRQRVQWALERLSYVPNMLARSFRTGSDDALGVAVPDIADPFFAAMVRSIEALANAEGMAVVITSLTMDPARERPALEALLRRQIAGLIVAPVAHDQSYLEPWQARTPIVFVDRPPARLTAPRVVQNDHAGAYAAVEHLIRHGHRRIAFIGDSMFVRTTHSRLDGYKSALRTAGCPYDPALVYLMDGEGNDAAGAVGLLAAANPPTAFFSSNPRCTMAIFPALQDLERTDVGLVGFGDFNTAAALRPAITVIDQDPDGLGRTAVARLLERIGNPARRVRMRTVLPVRLIVRGSGELRPG